MPSHTARLRGSIFQLVRYFGVAGSLALFYLAAYALGLALGWHYFVAILVAQVVAIMVAFPVYRVFVFRSKGPIAIDFVRFLSVWATGAIAGIIVTPLLVELIGIDPLWAQIVAVLLVSVGSFLAHRFFSFRSATPHHQRTGVPRSKQGQP